MKKKPIKLEIIRYTEDALAAIEARVAALKENRDWRMSYKYEFDSDTQVRIFEVISRYRGDAGLSESGVKYLTMCIMHVISQLTSDLERCGRKNQSLEAECTRLNSQVNQLILTDVLGGMNG